MKTNIEKAIDCLKDTFDNATGHYVQNPSEILVTHENALEAIKIASKTTWYYPSKGEYPNLDKGFCNVYAQTNLGYFNLTYCKTKIWFGNGSGNKVEEKDIIAWTYLPKFEENG